ncbi:hypothetical protein JTE90_001610 [Oedothorax gibbosus]|uniref:Uncharacterized protein n=1 Tax=Oedothorax gibbosus TaxID=931172 RepID=A0AAV6VPL5_9ARAC|nr:hypothetical protein JTE90_001610 [Oedothorax gibbosus]
MCEYRSSPNKKRRRHAIDFLAPSRTRGWVGGRGCRRRRVFAKRSSEGVSERLLFPSRQTKRLKSRGSLPSTSVAHERSRNRFDKGARPD